MAHPISVALPADLPEDWQTGQTVAPQGSDVGLTERHGYNYLMKQVNAAQTAAAQLGASFGSPGGAATLDEEGRLTQSQIPDLSTSQITGLDDALGGKQDAVTGGASTITSSNLTTNRALISNGSGKVAVSAVTATELGYLDGVTSAIQTQLNGKAASSHNHSAANITSGTLSADRIPNLSAGKITSGTLPVARGGTGVTSLSALVTALGTGRVAVGSYAGTGETGVDHPNSLTFPFVPKLIWIPVEIFSNGTMINYQEYGVFAPLALTTGYKKIGPTFYNGGSCYAKCSSDKKTVYWYADPSYNDSTQLNNAGSTYYYFAIG